MFEQLSMPDADVLIDRDFFTPAESDTLFSDLTANIVWEQKPIVFMGKEVMQPRLTAWYGDEGKSYTYSGWTVDPLPWTPTLLALRARVEGVAGIVFNSPHDVKEQAAADDSWSRIMTFFGEHIGG